ncbi:MAG: peptidoglycan-binding protein [Selenomonadaceae bacterium]|nr:peptidoglycan-binding protein [Selenomonadaceae bacterium]
MKRRSFFLGLFMFLVMHTQAQAFPVSEGSRGEEVYAAQVLLIAGGFLGDGADGDFGGKTKAAVIKAQEHFGFEANGTVGNALYNMLLEYATNKGKGTADSGGEVRIGSRGKGVEEVQEKLKAFGYYDGLIDGVAGVKTAVAVAKFQRKCGIWSSGIVNKETREAIETRPAKRAGKTITMHATAYSPQDPGVGKYTATGARVRKGIVAVDPKVIPLGTKLYIEGYGEAVAADVGGGIKNYVIDIAFDTHSEAIAFGRRNVVVTILE